MHICITKNEITELHLASTVNNVSSVIEDYRNVLKIERTVDDQNEFSFKTMLDIATISKRKAPSKHSFPFKHLIQRGTIVGGKLLISFTN